MLAADHHLLLLFGGEFGSHKRLCFMESRRNVWQIFWLATLMGSCLGQYVPIQAQDLPAAYLAGTQADYEGDYPEAIRLFRQLLDSAIDVGDEALQLRCLNSLGVVHTNLHQYERAKAFHLQALRMEPGHIDSLLWSNCLLGLGNVYNHTGKLDSSQRLYEQSLAIKQLVGDPTDLPVVLGNLASLGWKTNQMDLALRYDQQALELHQRRGDRRGEAEARNNLAYVYREMGRLTQAQAQARQGLNLARGLGERQIQLRCLINLSTISARLGNHEAGFDYQRQYIYLKDSLYSEENQRIISEMEAKYETAQKEKDLALQQATIAEQKGRIRLQGLMIAGVLLLMLLTIGTLIYRFQRRRWQMQSHLQAEQQEALRLKGLDEFKSHFFTNLTHEFRTPLTVILGLAESQPTDETWAMVHRNGRQLLRLINQLLDLSKLEAGKMHLQWGQVELSQLLRYLTESFRSLADQKGVSLRFLPPDAPLHTDVDQEKVQMIVSNLLSNALKFTPEGGEVQVQVQQEGAHWVCSVQDSGPGIAPEEQERIFDRFEQGKTAQGGTGIGLALSRELANLMGGSLEVAREVAQGSRFILRLPLRSGAAPMSELLRIPADHPPKPVSNSIPSADSRPRILLVEDNADVVAYLHHCLADSYELLVAGDGKMGVQIALEQVPDAIISDVMMPEMDGFALCHTLKQDERSSHIPIVLLTARAAIEDRLQGLRFGADAYLAKPFDREELLIRVEQLILLRHKLQARYRSLAALPAPATETEQQQDAFIQKVREQVLAHLTEEAFSVEALAEQLHLSRTQLYRKIKALTGRSVSQFVNLIRIEQAQQLLRSTDLTVSEIGYQIGFADPNYFMRVFAKEVGKSAGEWRSG